MGRRCNIQLKCQRSESANQARVISSILHLSSPSYWRVRWYAARWRVLGSTRSRMILSGGTKKAAGYTWMSLAERLRFSARNVELALNYISETHRSSQEMWSSGRSTRTPIRPAKVGKQGPAAQTSSRPCIAAFPGSFAPRTEFIPQARTVVVAASKVTPVSRYNARMNDCFSRPSGERGTPWRRQRADKSRRGD